MTTISATSGAVRASRPSGEAAAPMQVRDGVYGQFTIPGYLVRLVLTPEVYRLSQIRLVNTPSPSLPALGDIRRFSHTLGVLHLSRLARRIEFSEEEWMALEASVLLHDIGSAPFGHLLEYHLSEHTPAGWNHEAMIANVLASVHAPENSAHQIYANRAVRVRKDARLSGINLDLVDEIVSSRHPLSKLVFGSVDLDNLDNVARMGWAIGLAGGAEAASGLARRLRVTRAGDLSLDEEPGRELIRAWLKIRRAVYEALLFDLVAVSLQAVLSEAIGVLVERQIIEANDWSLTDEQLLQRLLNAPETKRRMTQEYFGIPPIPVFCVRLDGTLAALGFNNRQDGKIAVETALNESFGSEASLGYVIVDRGTFEKRVEFIDSSGEPWTEGTSTASVLFYGFLRRSRRLPREECLGAASEFIRRVGCETAAVADVQLGCAASDAYDQPTFGFETEEHRLGLLR